MGYNETNLKYFSNEFAASGGRAGGATPASNAMSRDHHAL